MKTYFLDTSVIIDYLRGKEETVDLISSIQGDLASSYICLSELFEGVYRVKNRKSAKDVLLHFFTSLTTIFGLDERIAEKFGQIRKDLKVKGNIIEDLDIFIAATCIVYDLTLITHNKEHFSRVRDLKIYSYN